MHFVRFEATQSQGNEFVSLETWSLLPATGQEWHAWEDEDSRHTDHFGVSRRYVAWSDAPFSVIVDCRYQDARGVRREQREYVSVSAPDGADVRDWEEWATVEAYDDAVRALSPPPPLRTLVPRRR